MSMQNVHVNGEIRKIYHHFLVKKSVLSGPSCSKLTTSLVNDSLKFTLSDTQMCWNFCWKNVSSFCSAKATHIFSAKNFRKLCIESAKTVNGMTLNELVKLRMLWTTRPWSFLWFHHMYKPFYPSKDWWTTYSLPVISIPVSSLLTLGIASFGWLHTFPQLSAPYISLYGFPFFMPKYATTPCKK